MTHDERRALAILPGLCVLAQGRPLSDLTEAEKEELVKAVAPFMRAIRQSDDAAGFVLVPRDPTARMCRAGSNAKYPMGAGEVWQAMLAAATGAADAE